MNYLNKLTIFGLFFVFCLTLISSSVSAAGTIYTVDTNYFTEDANINLTGAGWIDVNVVLRIYDPVNDTNYWSGTDFNIIDNNSTTVCDENVYLAYDPVTATTGSGTTDNDYDGYYIETPITGDTCLGTSGTFDVNVQVPLQISHGKAEIYGHQHTAASGISDSNFSSPITVFITPYLTILGDGYTRTRLDTYPSPNSTRDTNLMIRGIGFPQDSNVTFTLYKYDGTNVDTNIMKDGTGTVYSVTGCGDAAIMCDFNSVTAATVALNDGNYVFVGNTNFASELGTGNISDTNAWGFYRNGPDAVVLTGGFDINLTIPSDETIGQGFAIDWNVISANILAGDDVAWVSSDANKAVELDGLDANVVVFPTIIHTEAQLQVSVSGSTYDLNYAMRDGNISNFEAISGITLTSLTNAGDVKIAFSDINLLGYTTELSAPYIDIDTNFSAEEGILEFETDPGELTMFNVDSNITFYDVLSPGAMPVLLKNGKLCSSTDCKNWDGTSVINDSTDASGNITWANNGTDGNLLFNVPGFSIYSTSLLSATIVSPNGDSNSLRQTDADGNALIIFTYYDLNETVTDNGPTVNLHYSDTNGGMQGIIITDANVHDNEIITCTNEDSNYATVNTCVYAWDLNGIGPGEFWVDLNIIDFDDTGRVKWMYDHSDANFLVNAPVIEFIDDSIFVEYPTAEQNGGSFLNPEYTQPFSADGNLWMRIDFNVFFPNDQNSMYDLNNLQIVFDHDTNALNGYDGNFVDGNYLVDANAYGVAFAPNLGQVSSVDLNLGEICSYCAGGDANAQIDMNCHFNVNMGEADDGGSIQGTLKGIWYLRIDANYGSIYSPYKVAIGTTRPEANPVTGNTEGTYINKIYNLDFNVSDPDWFDYNKMDGNFLFADFYLDSDSNYWNGAGTLVINDLNLATSGTCTQDLNWADSNSAIDNNCLYAWDTTALTDGNYYLHIDLNEGAAGNYTSDFNTTLTSFVIDNTVPIVSITSGTGSQATDSPTITWAASDATAGIETIYVTIDSGTPVTLGRAETSYSFSGLGTGNHYVDVNVVDLAGNSADASAQINVTTGGTTTTTTTGSTGGPTGGTGTTEPTTSTISTGTITTETTTEQITSVLTEAGLSTTAIEGAIGALEKIIAETGYKVEKTVQKGKTTIYATTITNTITNSTDNVLTNVKVYAEIPKTIASNASEISSAQAFTIIKADPILLFTIDQIAAGSSATIKYTVNKNVAEADLKAMTQPIVAEFTEVQPDLCEGIECNDNNPCTSDSCLNGECSYSKLADKTACGTNKECKNGVCITKTTTPTGQAAPKTTEPVSGAFDFTTIIIVIIFIVIIIIAFAVMRQRKTGLRK